MAPLQRRSLNELVAPRRLDSRCKTARALPGEEAGIVPRIGFIDGGGSSRFGKVEGSWRWGFCMGALNSLLRSCHSHCIRSLLGKKTVKDFCSETLTKHKQGVLLQCQSLLKYPCVEK